ncbi:hypothetical protein DENSPDRAFT_399440 [Dentipellis sp. KUC8613]|nr:hypothetical protein DENSPDRAFT_399440 [Dentipellis sp. KUC8613]
MSSSASLIQVDDTDPSVQYYGNWKTMHNLSNAFNDTVHYTMEAGSSIRLVFSGTNLQVFGAANSPGDALNYMLDSQPLSAVPLVQSDGDHQNHNSPQMQSLIHVPDIPCSQHTLVLQPEQFMIFDQITYSSTCTSPSGSASVSTTFGSVSTTMESSSTSSSSTSNRSTSNTAASLPTARRTMMAPGAIAGIAIGAMLFIVTIFLFLAFFVRNRRRRHMESPSVESASLGRAGTIEPLIVPYGSATFGSSSAQLPFSPKRQQTGDLRANSLRDETRSVSIPSSDPPQYEEEYEDPPGWIRPPDPALLTTRSDSSVSLGEGGEVTQQRVMEWVSQHTLFGPPSSKLRSPYGTGGR